MWLKFHQSTLNGIDEDKGVFSSGGHGNGKVSFGGVALFVEKDGPLKLRIKKKLNSIISAWTCDCNITAGWAERWIHVAGTWSLGGGVKLYIDGALNATGNRDDILNPEDPVLPKTMHVGKLNSDNENYGQFVLDDWYFWNLELSGDQVAQMYSAYQTGTRASPLFAFMKTLLQNLLWTLLQTLHSLAFTFNLYREPDPSPGFIYSATCPGSKHSNPTNHFTPIIWLTTW